jgi:acetyl-CoA carboxylase biotin carboxylase subunit
MIRRLLIANRGEIAVRIIRACRELGIESAAVYSEADAKALHVQLSDVAACIGPAAPRESYLKVEKVQAAARELECDALHPGYGFLSENAEFAEAVTAAGLTWIGPPSECIRAMGDKLQARKLAEAAGVPVVPGWNTAQGPTATDYPVLVKASAGGGGKGMRLVRSAPELESAIAAAQREAQSAFGDGTVYIEKYLERPRHIEIQVLADQHGECIHLGERECSIQRRHQKVIEECPSPFVTTELRHRMGEAAVSLATAVGYIGAGTVEFIVAPDGSYYFIEMNTRLQVEHPVTEFVYGLDLVQWQLRVANRERLPASLSPHPRGHAIEARICAEDPAQSFLPQTGTIGLYREPCGPGVRVDSGVYQGWTVGTDYDPLLAKLIVYAEDRPRAIARLDQALKELRMLGVQTNADLMRAVLGHPEFAAGDTHTGFLDEHFPAWQQPAPSPEERIAAALALTFGARRSMSIDKAADSSGPESPWESLGSWSNVVMGQGNG